VIGKISRPPPHGTRSETFVQQTSSGDGPGLLTAAPARLASIKPWLTVENTLDDFYQIPTNSPANLYYAFSREPDLATRGWAQFKVVPC
jgi:hypothetical protein